MVILWSFLMACGVVFALLAALLSVTSGSCDRQKLKLGMMASERVKLLMDGSLKIMEGGTFVDKSWLKSDFLSLPSNSALIKFSKAASKLNCADIYKITSMNDWETSRFQRLYISFGSTTESTK